MRPRCTASTTPRVSYPDKPYKLRKRRYMLEELEGMVRDAERLVPGTAEATAAALHRKRHP